MANILNRNIERDEIVVLKKELFKEEYQSLNERLVKVKDGFGMKSFTSGTAIYVEFLSDGEKCRYEGFDIDKDETIQYQLKQAMYKE